MAEKSSTDGRGWVEAKGSSELKVASNTDELRRVLAALRDELFSQRAQLEALRIKYENEKLEQQEECRSLAKQFQDYCSANDRIMELHESRLDQLTRGLADTSAQTESQFVSLNESIANHESAAVARIEQMCIRMEDLSDVIMELKLAVNLGGPAGRGPKSKIRGAATIIPFSSAAALARGQKFPGIASTPSAGARTPRGTGHPPRPSPPARPRSVIDQRPNSHFSASRQASRGTGSPRARSEQSERRAKSPRSLHESLQASPKIGEQADLPNPLAVADSLRSSTSILRRSPVQRGGDSRGRIPSPPQRRPRTPLGTRSASTAVRSHPDTVTPPKRDSKPPRRKLGLEIATPPAPVNLTDEINARLSQLLPDMVEKAVQKRVEEVCDSRIGACASRDELVAAVRTWEQTQAEIREMVVSNPPASWLTGRREPQSPSLASEEIQRVFGTPPNPDQRPGAIVTSARRQSTAPTSPGPRRSLPSSPASRGGFGELRSPGH